MVYDVETGKYLESDMNHIIPNVKEEPSLEDGMEACESGIANIALSVMSEGEVNNV